MAQQGAACGLAFLAGVDMAARPPPQPPRGRRGAAPLLPLGPVDSGSGAEECGCRRRFGDCRSKWTVWGLRAVAPAEARVGRSLSLPALRHSRAPQHAGRPAPKQVSGSTSPRGLPHVHRPPALVLPLTPAHCHITVATVTSAEPDLHPGRQGRASKPLCTVCACGDAASRRLRPAAAAGVVLRAKPRRAALRCGAEL